MHSDLCCQIHELASCFYHILRDEGTGSVQFMHDVHIITSKYYHSKFRDNLPRSDPSFLQISIIFHYYILRFLNYRLKLGHISTSVFATYLLRGGRKICE